MKVVFADGSFLEILPNKEGDKLNFVMCGFKDFNQLTMSSSELNEDQIEELITFLTNWKTNEASALDSDSTGV